LTDDGIRVRYSGMIVFAAQILSVATGLMFILLLTRNTSAAEYGTWTFISTATGQFFLFSGLFSFWATRFAARKKEGTIKTGLVANLGIGLAATVLYLLFLPLILQNLHVANGYFFVFALASFTILNTYSIYMLESCLRSVKPQTTGYGLLIEEVVKVAVAYFIFFRFNELFTGALVGLILGAAVQSIYYVWVLRDYLKERIQLSYIKEWIKGSTAFLYTAVGAQLSSLQFFMLYNASPASSGNFGAAGMFTNVVGYAASLAFALYPKLLSNNCKDSQVNTSFSTMMMMAIPLAGIAIVMSVSLLSVLNVSYVTAWPVLSILVIDTVIAMIASFYSNYLMGAENFDMAGSISVKQLVKSKIFKVLSISYLQTALIIPLTYISLTFLPITDPVRVAEYIAVILIISHLTTLVLIYWMAMRSSAGSICINRKEIAKYLGCAAIMAIALYLIPTTTTLTLTLIKALIGIGIYFGLLLLIDNQARILIKLIYREIKAILGLSKKDIVEP
jgi:O-antigen/teichoic acid export membrane protein